MEITKDSFFKFNFIFAISFSRLTIQTAVHGYAIQILIEKKLIVNRVDEIYI